MTELSNLPTIADYRGIVPVDKALMRFDPNSLALVTFPKGRMMRYGERGHLLSAPGEKSSEVFEYFLAALFVIPIVWGSVAAAKVDTDSLFARENSVQETVAVYQPTIILDNGYPILAVFNKLGDQEIWVTPSESDVGEGALLGAGVLCVLCGLSAVARAFRRQGKKVSGRRTGSQQSHQSNHRDFPNRLNVSRGVLYQRRCNI